jgi:hypothetical protein
MIKGYKAFNKDLCCRGFQYELGKTYEQEEAPICCGKGFHFCKNAADVFNYYKFDANNTRVCEVIAHGMVAEEGDKCSTNKIEVVRELTWEEFLEHCNTGKANSGLNNSGDYNTGNRNTGYGNTGNRNTGDYNTGYGNTGDRNTGDYNTGDYNTGDYNTGNRNTGDYNTGNRNTGYGNTTNYSNGVFCTEEPTVCFFNKPSEMKLSEFMCSDARYILDRYFYLTKWIWSDDMTDEEKSRHPEHETTGGYLKSFGYKEAWINAWNRMDSYERSVVKSLPNFNADIFKDITGIEVE